VGHGSDALSSGRKDTPNMLEHANIHFRVPNRLFLLSLSRKQ
jgi:hypothetical protein